MHLQNLFSRKLVRLDIALQGAWSENKQSWPES